MTALKKPDPQVAIAVCDYLTRDVIAYLDSHTTALLITLYKEVVTEYRGNRVIYINDLLASSDYRAIHQYVERTLTKIGHICGSNLAVDGYNLFEYVQAQLSRDILQAYTFIYLSRNILGKKGQALNITFLTRDHILSNSYGDLYDTRQPLRNRTLQHNHNVAASLKRRIRDSAIIEDIVEKLFTDRRRKTKSVLWLGGRSINSKLPGELRKHFKIYLLENDVVHKFGFARRGIRFCVLRPSPRFESPSLPIQESFRTAANEISEGLGVNPSILNRPFAVAAQQVRDLLLTLSTLQYNLEQLDVVLVQESIGGRSALATDFFTKHGLPSIELMHGIPTPIEVGRTSKIAVCGRRDATYLSEHGVDRDKIVRTGFPSYDQYFRMQTKAMKYKFLLLILEPIRDLPRMFEDVTNLLKLLQQLSAERLVIKLHQRECAAGCRYVHRLASCFGVQDRVVVTKDANLRNLLRRSRIVYTSRSSVGVEAMLIKKPLIVLDFVPGRKIDYEKYNACVVVNSYDKLLSASRRILSDIEGYLEKQEENFQLTRRYFSDDATGNSYVKVSELVRSLS